MIIPGALMQNLITLAKAANALRANPRLDLLDGFSAQLDAAVWESPFVYLPTAALSSSASRLRSARGAVAEAAALLGRWEGAAGDAARQSTTAAGDRLGVLSGQLEDDLLPAIEAFSNRLSEIATVCDHCDRELSAVRQFLPQVRAAAALADPAAPEVFRRVASRTFETLFQLTNAYSEYMQVSADLVRLLRYLGDGLRSDGLRDDGLRSEGLGDDGLRSEGLGGDGQRAAGKSSPAPARSLA